VFVLRTFGRTELRRSRPAGGEDSAVELAPKPLGLLAYLAVEGPGVFQRRDALLALFWPELDQHHARNALTQIVHRLRSALGREALLSRGREEVAVSGRLLCDAALFERRLRAGEPREALELYGGPLLDGFHLPGVPAFGRWLDVRRSGFARAAERAAVGLGRQEEAAGNPAGAARWFRRALDVAPLHESSVLDLMRVLDLSGDRSGAIYVFEAFTARLRDELDLEPAPETCALAERIRGHGQVRPGSVESAGSSRAAPVGADPSATRSTEPGHRIRSIAVLPLRDLTSGGAHEHFAEGITAAVITELGRLGEFRVVSSQSVIRFRGSDSSLPAIAEALDVDALVEGSVLHTGERVRIDAQLFRARPEEHLWTGSYERDASDVLSVIREVASGVASEVQTVVRSGPGAGEPPGPHPKPAPAGPRQGTRRVDPRAYELLLRGRYLTYTLGEEDLRTGRSYLEQSIQLDPGFAPAHAWLAMCCGDLAVTATMPPHEVLPAMERAAGRAAALDPDMPEAHLAAGYCGVVCRRWEEGERGARRAVELDPNNAFAWVGLAFTCTVRSRFDEAIESGRRAVELDPLSLRTEFMLGWTLHEAGCFEAASEQFARVVELYPSAGVASLFHMTSLHLGGQDEKALGMLGASPDPAGAHPMQLGYVAAMLGRVGRRAEAEQLLAELERRSRDGWVDPFYLAVARTGLGHTDEALRYLGEVVEGDSASAYLLACEPFLEPLRGDARFRELLERVGLG
jgi:TolB-like protein/DNA-binding SARP family transcriptional activator